jgi:membrane-associated phospholipid phosphatase
MKRSFRGTLLLVLFTTSILSAQNRYDLSQFGNETVEFIKQPLHWEQHDWLKLGLATAGTVLIMQLDQPVRDAMLKDRSYYKSAPIEFGRLWGDTYSTVAVAGGVALHGILARDKSTQKVAFEVAQAALYAGGITTALKLALGRARPFTNRGASEFRPFTMLDDDFHALPSGHATLAFALSTVLSRNASSRALKVIAFLPAVLTAFSRIYQDYHWTSDCLLGGIIGYAVATWVVDQHNRNESAVSVSSIYPLTIRIVLN